MSKIEWTDITWNPITGCTQYSEGCQNCFAMNMHKRLTAMGVEKYSQPFNKVVFHKEALYQHKFSRLDKKGKLIFVNSMSDTFHKDITDLQIKELLDECEWNDPNIFQILTKRAERVVDFEYPFNVWLGVTVETANHKDRIYYLRRTNAPVKFLSCEPLLEDLGELDLTGIDWVICGGESGHKARPMHPDWVRNIQRQCEEQNVPFFFKQWGEFTPIKNSIEYLELPKTYWIDIYGRVTIVKNHISPFLRYDRATPMKKVGKAKSGALLDGEEYKEFPKGYEVRNGKI